jgi:hypothetical protein
MRLKSRFRIIGFGILDLGAFLLPIDMLELVESGSASLVASFSWVYAILGITLILVGLETLSLTARVSDPTDAHPM